MSDYGEQEHADTAAPDAPDFSNATEVCRWFGSEIMRLVSAAKREKALSRLRALGSALDTWQKLYRLSVDTSELEQLRAELDELRAIIEDERRAGPVGVIRKQS